MKFKKGDMVQTKINLIRDSKTFEAGTTAKVIAAGLFSSKVTIEIKGIEIEDVNPDYLVKVN